MTKGRGKRGGKGAKPRGSRRDVSRRRPAEDEWDTLFEEIRSQTDRATALIAGSLVDATLRLAVESKIHEGVRAEQEAMFEDARAPLGSFSSRISVAWALGIFGAQMRSRLTIIRHIRNTFAHALVPIDFNEPAIANECTKLPLHDLREPPLPADWSEARKRYVTTCYVDSMDLAGWAIRNGGKEMVVELD
jgi:hypothetical protein